MTGKRKGPRGRLLVDLAWTEAVLCALVGLQWLASGSVVVSAGGAAVLGAGVALAVFLLRCGRRRKRRGCEVPRALLLALARERASTDGVWVNRDEHLAFTVEAAGRWPVRRWLVCRADEDQVRGLEEAGGGGRLALTADMFTVMAAAPEVFREPIGAVALLGEGEPVIEEQGKASAGGFRRFRLRFQAVRSGHLYASADELRELAGQLQAAELFAPDGPSREQ